VQTTGNFSGLWVPLITPFFNHCVDHAALAKLVQHLSGTGIAGFVVCGSTGEAAALDKDEQLAVLATVLTAAAGLPVVMGVSGYHLPQTLDWVQSLGQQPLVGLLVSAPHYIRPAQSGLRHWFQAIADASAQPIIVYDIPYRTGVQLELATLRRLAQHPRIRAIKDCGGDSSKTQALIADGQLQVLAGEDAQIFSTLALGGSGAISASAHLNTELLVQIMQAITRGELARARAQWRSLLPLMQALFAEPNPGPLKALLAQQGWIHNELRWPMTIASEELSQRVVQISGALNHQIAQDQKA
jgi:4-hydroxy-tetrahydrodipicolinate synthase